MAKTVDLRCRMYFTDPPAASMGLRVFSDQARWDIRMEMDKLAREMQMFMKSSHPWRNRTGDAETNLFAKVETISKHGWNQQIVFGHGDGSHSGKYIYYGKYLEYGYGGRFSIVEPTLRRFGHRLSDDLVSGGMWKVRYR